MSNYNNLKTTIDANIKQNGNQEITGPILNSVLNQMVNILGTGYQFAGIAVSDTNPGTPDAKVFYIANGKGKYTNFGGLEVTEDEVVVLYWDTAWHKVATGIASQAKLSELEFQFGQLGQKVNGKTSFKDKEVNKRGTLSDKSGWNATDFIPISLSDTDTVIWKYADSAQDDSTGFICFYDASRSLLDYFGMLYDKYMRDIRTSQLSGIYERVAYIRATYKEGSDSFVKIGTNPVWEVQDNKGIEEKLQEQLDEKVESLDSTGNIMYQSLRKENFYVNHKGALVANNSMDAVYMMPINGKAISVTNVRAGNSSSVASYVFYDSQQSIISYILLDNNTDILNIAETDIPEGAKFVSFTLTKKPSTFSSVTSITELLEIVNNKGKEQNIVSNSLYGNGILDQNQYLLLPQVHIIKNILQSAKFVGTIDAVQVGCGYLETIMEQHPTHRGYGALWAKITQTQLLIYMHYSYSDTLVGTYNHELTLTNETTVVISCKYAEGAYSTTIEIGDGEGNIFSQALSGSWGYGMPFAQNLGATSVDVEMRFMPRDIYNPIWVFGDSYINLTAGARWPYYVAQLGFTHFLLDSRPGENAAEAFVDINNLISAGGRPKMLCWCLGMNGGEDTQSGNNFIINSSQKKYVDSIKKLCEDYNITPIFATIPTVPTLQHTALSEYIRNLGCRYIDFAEAVGSTPTGEWKTGMLSNDGVHPSELGAKALAMRAMLDFPELAEGCC